MRRRLNGLLYTFGIAEGLEVVKSSSKTVTVRPGVALDRLGQEMILEADHIVDLSNAIAIPADVTVFITLACQEQESDPTTATGVSGNTHITEQPIVQAVTATPPSDGRVVQLARLTLDASANVPGNVNNAFDGGVRQRISPRGERGPASIDNVSNPGGSIDLVSGTGIVISPDQANRRITIAASGAQGLVSVDGVSNPGGNVDLVATQAIAITPNDANNTITIGENHSMQTGNVHGLTAANLQQIGALLASDYDLRQRAGRIVTFSQLDANQATRTAPPWLPTETRAGDHQLQCDHGLKAVWRRCIGSRRSCGRVPDLLRDWHHQSFQYGLVHSGVPCGRDLLRNIYQS